MRFPKLFFSFFTLLLFSCDKDIAFDSEFDKSLEAWRSIKKKEGESYSYTRNFGSVFGFGSNTKITVTNGVVTAREYQAYTANGSETEITDTWVENQDGLGEHEEGAEPITLDAIYNSCKNEILTVSESDNYITFLTENDGILSTCSYFPKNCQDDCSIGFNITSISWID